MAASSALTKLACLLKCALWFAHSASCFASLLLTQLAAHEYVHVLLLAELSEEPQEGLVNRQHNHALE